jgi:hypothetical protein
MNGSLKKTILEKREPEKVFVPATFSLKAFDPKPSLISEHPIPNEKVV